jgi:hypothetical protein
MAYIDTWNAAFELLPADLNALSDGATKIRALKVAIRERIAKDHYMAVAGTDVDHGEHSKITFQAQSAKPAAVANKGFLYTKDVSAKVELFFEDEDGDEVQLTTGGVIATAATVNTVLTDQATIAWDLSLGTVATVTLGGNRTMAAPSNLVVGVYVLHVIQDGTGSRTITWNAVFKWQAAVAPTLSTGVNKHDILSFICDGTYLYGSYMLDVR